jgi:acetyltransferase-like isoleucine patch superfamily enzyme
MDRKKILLDSKENDLTELFKLICKLEKKLDSEFISKLDRSLPLNELIIDRWDRANRLGFGIGSSIYNNSFVFGNVKVGDNTWIGPMTILDGSGSLIIGNNCSISSGVQIYSHDSVNWAISGGKDPYEYSETIIGNNCYVGPNSIIARGIILGNRCIVGANSFVNKSFPDGSKIAGTPARCI